MSKQQQARLAKVFIRARQEANLTQDQLMDRLGASDAFINKIENGKRNVGFFEFHTIVKAMDQDPIKPAREFGTAMPDHQARIGRSLCGMPLPH